MLRKQASLPSGSPVHPQQAEEHLTHPPHRGEGLNPPAMHHIQGTRGTIAQWVSVARGCSVFCAPVVTY